MIIWNPTPVFSFKLFFNERIFLDLFSDIMIMSISLNPNPFSKNEPVMMIFSLFISSFIIEIAALTISNLIGSIDLTL